MDVSPIDCIIISLNLYEQIKKKKTIFTNWYEKVWIRPFLNE